MDGLATTRSSLRHSRPRFLTLPPLNPSRSRQGAPSPAAVSAGPSSLPDARPWDASSMGGLRQSKGRGCRSKRSAGQRRANWATAACGVPPSVKNPHPAMPYPGGSRRPAVARGRIAGWRSPAVTPQCCRIQASACGSPGPRASRASGTESSACRSSRQDAPCLSRAAASVWCASSAARSCRARVEPPMPGRLRTPLGGSMQQGPGRHQIGIGGRLTLESADLAHNPFQNGLLARQKDRPTLGTKFLDLRRKEGLFGAETLEDWLGEVESLHEPNSD